MRSGLIFITGVTLQSNPWNVPLFGATYYILTGLHGSARRWHGLVYPDASVAA